METNDLTAPRKPNPKTSLGKARNHLEELTALGNFGRGSSEV